MLWNLMTTEGELRLVTLAATPAFPHWRLSSQLRAFSRVFLAFLRDAPTFAVSARLRRSHLARVCRRARRIYSERTLSSTADFTVQFPSLRSETRPRNHRQNVDSSIIEPFIFLNFARLLAVNYFSQHGCQNHVPKDEGECPQ